MGQFSRLVQTFGILVSPGRSQRLLRDNRLGKAWRVTQPSLHLLSPCDLSWGQSPRLRCPGWQGWGWRRRQQPQRPGQHRPSLLTGDLILPATGALQEGGPASGAFVSSQSLGCWVARPVERGGADPQERPRGCTSSF